MTREILVAGWREWVRLPDLGIQLIQAKVDSGARTSALHAEGIRYVRRGARRFVRFRVHPRRPSRAGAVEAVAPLLDQRKVRSSNGVLELRPVIATSVDVGGQVWVIELTLTSRELMGLPMLLGRQALRKRILVDPGRIHLTRKVRRKRRPAGRR